MSELSPQRLARFVEPSLPESRLARQWAAIEARVGASPRAFAARWTRARWVGALGAAAVVAIVALAIVIASRPRAEAGARVEGAVLESTERASFTLADGSRIVLDRASAVKLATLRAESVEVSLERGALDVEVEHRAGRSFAVLAGRYRIVDVGTVFRVERDGDRVTVVVKSGRVNVSGGGSTKVIDAGETWSSAATEAAPAPGSATASASATEPEPVPAPATASASATGSASASASMAAPAEPGPKELLDTAKQARLHGKPREAAAALDTLRRKYRGDPRAGLAAFELGRLRQDSFGDAKGALEAFDDAIALSPGAGFREDAEARRIDALDAMHAGARCVAAREAYLARYPRGVHAATVQGKCGGAH